MLRNHTLHRAYRMAAALAGLAVTLTTAACGKDAATSPGDALNGNFTLQSVEGEDPPVTVFNGKARTGDGQVVDLKVSVQDSEVELDGDDGYFVALVLKVTVNGNTATQSISNEGTYERSGTRIEFSSDDPDLSDFTGTWSGGRLTLRLDIMGNGDEYSYVYSKGR